MFEAYAVSVRVSLINGVTAGLMNISRAFAKAHGDATKLQRQLDAIKFKMIGGAVLAGSGVFGLSLLGKTLPAARDYAHQLQQMNVAGMKHLEIVQATQAAWAASRDVPTATAAENLAAIRELRMVFGNTRDAISNMPAVQQLQAILANVKGVAGGRDEAYTVAKALEMKGAVRSPAEFKVEADLMAKAIVASGGKVGAQDFLGTFKYGRSATIGWDRHFAFEILPTLIQEMKNSGGSGGAGGPGNALMSVYDKVINGRIAQKDIPLWAQLGLIDGSKIVRTKSGETKGLMPEAVTGWQTFQQDPYAWTQSVLMPALKAHGVTDPAKQQMYLSRLGGTRTAAFMLQQMGLQGWKFDRDVPLIRGAQGLNAYKTLLKNDPVMAQQALHSQWQNLLAVIGFQIMPTLVSATLKLVSGLRGLATVMREHPTLTKALVVGFAALSAALAFGGAVLMLSAAFDGLALAFTVIGPAILTVAGVVGGALATAFSAVLIPAALIAGAIVGIGVAIWQVVKHWDKSKSILGNIKAEFGMFLNWIWDQVKKLLPGHSGGKPMNAPHGAGNYPDGGHHPAVAPSNYTDLPSDGRSRFVAPAAHQNTTVHTQVNLDGRQIAKVVTHHQARAIGSTATSSGRPDPNAALPPAAAGY